MVGIWPWSYPTFNSVSNLY